MKNINSFVVNNEARQEDFECKCMQQEETLTRLNEEAIDNVNLNATLRLVHGMWETLNASQNRLLTQTMLLEKALERAEEARWEIEEHYDIVERKLHQEINNLHAAIIKEKKGHTNTKRITTRKINKLEKKIKELQAPSDVQETIGVNKRKRSQGSFAKISRSPASFLVPRN